MRSTLLLPIGIENEFFTTDLLGKESSGKVGFPTDLSFQLDFSAIAYIGIELISKGVDRILIDGFSGLAREVNQLPTSLQKRVVVANRTQEVWEELNQSLKPVYDDLRLDFDDNAELLHSFIGLNADRLSGNIEARKRLDLDDITFLHVNLFHLLLGIRSKCQIDVDGYGLAINLQRLRERCSSFEALHALSIYSSVLSNYRGIECGALIVKDDIDPERVVARLDEFLEERQFIALAQANSRLGTGKRIKEYLGKSADLAKGLTRNKRFSEFFDYGSKAITVATGIPLPGASLPKAMMSSSYLPPIVACGDAGKLAKKKWAKSRKTSAMSVAGMQNRNRAFRGPRSWSICNTSLKMTYDLFDVFEVFRGSEPPDVGDPKSRTALLEFLETNFADGVSCAEHTSRTLWKDLKIEFDSWEVSFEFPSCCEVQGIRSWVRTLSGSEMSPDEAKNMIQTLSGD